MTPRTGSMVKLTCHTTEIGGSHEQQACCHAGHGETLLKQSLLQGFYSSLIHGLIRFIFTPCRIYDIYFNIQIQKLGLMVWGTIQALPLPEIPCGEEDVGREQSRYVT